MTTQQTDRELLELAAKAVGFHDKLLFSDIHDTAYWHDRYSGDWGEHDAAAEWNPLTDDGDALRLAVLLRLTVSWDRFDDDDYATATPPHTHQGCDCIADQDPYAATRRAIVRAAAEIGRGMK